MRSKNGFAEKTAFVTGGASGIGRAIATQLVGEGARVMIADISGAAEAARVIGCQGISLDVTRAAAVAKAVEDFAAAHGRLDYIFNNAGVAILGEVKAMTDDDWRGILDVNLNGVLYGVRAAYPLMIGQGGGHIVNTASVAGLIATPGGVAYSTTKHAVVGLSVSLRAEARRYGVRVSAICPGFIRTPMADNGKMIGGLDRARALAVVERIGWMTPEDLARAALRGVRRNRAIIVAPRSARLMVGAIRRFPTAGEAVANVMAGVMQRLSRGA